MLNVVCRNHIVNEKYNIGRSLIIVTDLYSNGIFILIRSTEDTKYIPCVYMCVYVCECINISRFKLIFNNN